MLKRISNLFSKVKPRQFLVTSTGYSGSWWLASSLHLHPDIKCSMGIDAQPAAYDYYHNLPEITNIFRSNPTWHQHGVLFPKYFYLLLDKLEANGCIDSTEKSAYYNIVANAKPRDVRDLFDIIYHELEQTPFKEKTKIIGNVHGMSAEQFQNVLRRNNHSSEKAKTLTVYDLIRHPITRLDTFVNYKCQWYDTQKYSSCIRETVDKVLIERADQVKQLEKEFAIDFSQTRNKVFFWIEHVNSHILMNHQDVLRTPEFTRVKFEDLHKNPDYFASFIKNLCGINPDQSYIKKVFNDDNLKQGRASDSHKQYDRNDPKACFGNWSEWEQSTFRNLVNKHGLDKFYAEFGYDLSFVK